MVNAVINGRPVTAQEGTTILEAAQAAGFPIPHLCYLKEINEIAACRMCVVEVEGIDRLVPACNTELLDGMHIKTNSPRIHTARRTNLRLILSQHNSNCTTCIRSGNCQLQKMAHDLNIHYQPYEVKPERSVVDMTSPLIREAGKCIKCMRCIQICDKVQDMHIWDVLGTGSRATVGTATGDGHIGTTDCTFCGQCVTHCPTGALTARDDTQAVFHALADPDVVTVVQVAPAVRAAWAEQFGMAPALATTGRMVAAMRQVGFDYIFDTNFAADLTIMEEGSEFLERFTHRDQHRWPMFTSCCPGWVRFLKSKFPELTPNLSTAKSPQQMFGAVAKSYFAEKIGVDPHKIFVVSVMPCISKKAECALPTMHDACGDPDVDVVLTTRELVRILCSESIVPETLPEESFDSPLGSGTGAAVIFGVSGGVMDAALRSAYYLATGKNPDPDAFAEIRGGRPWREGSFTVPGAGTVRVAVVSGLANTRKLLETMQRGDAEYDFVEVMACPGGCAGGGGQPIHEGQELAEVRGDRLWALDATSDIRFSHENSDIQALYQEYLGAPLSERAHHLLHTDHAAWDVPSHQK